MTLPPFQNPITYWQIEIEVDGSTPFFADDSLYVSAKGYLARKACAKFESEKDAREFLRINRTEIERRCGTMRGFTGFVFKSAYTRWPVKFDEPISLRRIGKRGKSRNSLYRNGV